MLKSGLLLLLTNFFLRSFPPIVVQFVAYHVIRGLAGGKFSTILHVFLAGRGYAY